MEIKRNGYLNVQVERQKYQDNSGDATYIVEPKKGINLWLTILISVDVTVAILGLLYFVSRSKKMKKYIENNK